MKFSIRIILNAILLIPVFSATASGLLAQPADSSPSARISGAEDATPLRLNASLSPRAAGSDVQGTLQFSMTGDLLLVTGRIAGLDPNKRYRLNLSESVQLAKDVTGRDPAGNALNQGQLSDGHLIAARAGADDGRLGILQADASGNVTINTTLNGLRLATGPNQVLGSSVSLCELRGDQSELKPVQVASGLIKFPQSKVVAQPSRLDDLEPGEVWF